MKKYLRYTLFKEIIKFIFIFIFIFTSFEIGLRSRASLKNIFYRKNVYSSNSKMILVVGDSVLGGSEIPSSTFNKLKDNLELKNTLSLKLIDGIRAGILLMI